MKEKIDRKMNKNGKMNEKAKTQTEKRMKKKK